LKLPDGTGQESDAEKQVREWASERYKEFQESLLNMLSAAQVGTQEQALVSLMHLIQVEGKYPISKIEGKEQYFPLKPLEVIRDFCYFLAVELLIDSLLQNVVSRMLHLNKETIPVLTRFQEFIEYEDVLFNLLRVLGTILKAKVEEDENFLKNLVSVLEHITVNDNSNTADEERKLFCLGKMFYFLSMPQTELYTLILDKQNFKWNHSQAKKFFSQIWTFVLKKSLNASLYKRVLVMLPEKVLPHLEKPLLLTDFLMTSYSIGKKLV
jgi:U3 small nucleolar RNA-associated protein 19